MFNFSIKIIFEPKKKIQEIHLEQTKTFFDRMDSL